MSNIALQQKIEQWNLELIKPYDKNPRNITDKAVHKVAHSIREFGFQQPIVVDKQGVVIVGHTRLKAAQSLGLKQAPVIVADLSEAKARAYRIADNRTHQEATWLDGLLIDELKELESLRFDLEMTGFDVDELARLMLDKDFAPGSLDDQGKLDELAPKYVCCPNCGHEFDAREHAKADTQD